MRNLPNIYSSFHPGISGLTGVPGSFLDMFKACLVNGTTKVSFPEIIVTGGVALVKTIVDGKTFINGATITIEGCSEPLLNGNFVITEHNSKYFTFNTTAGDGTYGGSIKINQPPAGWEILFSGTNQAVFVSKNLDSLGVCILVSDVSAYCANFSFYENMESLVLGFNKNPDSFYIASNLLGVVKSAYATTKENNFWLVADNTNTYFGNERLTTTTTDISNISTFRGGFVHSFGSINTLLNPNDKRNFYYSGNALTNVTGAAYETTMRSTLNAGLSGGLNSSYLTSLFLSEMRTRGGWQAAGFFPQRIWTENGDRFSGAAVSTLLDSRIHPTSLMNDVYLMVIDNDEKNKYNFIGFNKVVGYYPFRTISFTDPFQLTVTNNKKYINIPLYNKNDAYSNSVIDNSLQGFFPILIGETWD